MVSLWIIFALLTGAAVFAVLWPLSRAPAVVDARELDVAFYEAQTAEIARDTARGVIGAAEAEVARVEAARRLMAAAGRGASGRVGDLAPPTQTATRVVALCSIVFVPVLALGLYNVVGTPNLPDQPLEARLKAAPVNVDMAAAIAKIERHLAEAPDDGRGWAVIAPVYLRLGRTDDAVRAFRNAIRTLGPDGERYASLGEAQMAAAGGTVTAEAKASFETAMRLHPGTPRAAFYLGVAAEQDGDKPRAVALWTKLVADAPPNAPWLPAVRSQIADAAGVVASDQPAAPAAGVPGRMAEAIAALPADQRQAAIHTMVDGLADRLRANGNDVEGWLRLMRAYRVLDEGDKAKAAMSDARRTFAGDPTATRRIDDLAQELGLKG